MLLTRRSFLAGTAATSGLLACQGASKGASIRDVDHVVVARGSRDGAGVVLRRSLGSGNLPI